jgi:esterase/lipase superfamily enzyme
LSGRPTIVSVPRWLALAAAISAAACSGPPLSIDLMPAPDLYASAQMDPFADSAPVESLPDFPLLYATLRQPATEDDRERFYTNRRDAVLRVGVARIEVGRKGLTWEEARRVSLAKNRPDRYPLKVTDVDEIGVAAASPFVSDELREEVQPSRSEFAKRVNERLARAHGKDVYLYVHGYKVVFENPLLVASELWHFLGYEGVMVAFSWPSTPKTLAYFSDLETASTSAQGFRRLIEILAEETDARRIHILGYSAGTRVVARALDQISLMSRGRSADEVVADWRIGEVALVGSDVDRSLMGSYIADGLLKTVERMTVYVSKSDKALAFSRRVLGGRNRLGQDFGEALDPGTERFLEQTDRLDVVDVTDAEEFDVGNGHAYFRKSPWASSDVLLTLSTSRPPAERGLVRGELPVWTFPPDYVERLRAVLGETLPSEAEPAE